MSGDTIVLRIQDQMEKVSNGCSTVMYILYDHEYERFLIRGNSIFGNNVDIIDHVEYDSKKAIQFKTKTSHIFSYYCDDKDQVQNLLTTFYKDFYKLTTSLRNYSNLPKDSDEITFDVLDNKEHEDKPFVIGVFDKFSKPGDKVDLSYDKFLNILMNLYNNW